MMFCGLDHHSSEPLLLLHTITLRILKYMCYVCCYDLSWNYVVGASRLTEAVMEGLNYCHHCD